MTQIISHSFFFVCLIFLFVHPILNVVAILIFLFFSGQTPFYFRVIAPAVSSGWNIFIPDLQIFSFVLSFQISTSVQRSRCRESLFDIKSEASSHFLSTTFYFNFLCSTHWQCIFLIYLFLDICMCVRTYTCICFILCLSQLEQNICEGKNFIYCVHCCISSVQNVIKTSAV